MSVRALLPMLCLVTGAATHPALAEDISGKGDEAQSFARTLTESATWAAVANPGVGVCKLMRIGIAERDWIRAVVVGIHKPYIRVRITDAGRFPHDLDGTAVSTGAILSVAPADWTPCKFD